LTATSEIKITCFDKLRMTEVIIYNSIGGQVYQSEIKNPKSEINIEVSEWARGMYFAEVSTEKGVRRKKIIIE